MTESEYWEKKDELETLYWDGDISKQEFQNGIYFLQEEWEESDE